MRHLGHALLVACGLAPAMTGCTFPALPELFDAADDAGANDGAPLDGPPRWSLTLRKPTDATGDGRFLVNGELVCDEACREVTLDYAGPTMVTLTAAAAAGDWYQGANAPCDGPARTCNVNVDGELVITGRFSEIDRNLVFVTSQTFAADFGTLANADARCATAATAAGITGGVWAAMLSTSTVDARDHISAVAGGAPQGWIRIDGKPFSDGLTGLADTYRVWHPVLFDEYGVARVDDFAWTGSGYTLRASPNNCMNWTDGSPNPGATVGRPDRGPGDFTYSGFGMACHVPTRLVCFMVNQTTPVVQPPSPGKRIWLSQPFVPGGGVAAADALCNSAKPAGVGPSRALLATTTRAAADLIAPEQLYVRHDGPAIGTGADIIAASRNERLLHTGIWLSAFVYVADRRYAWTGATGPLTAPGDDASTCQDWTSTAGQGVGGELHAINASFWRPSELRQDCSEHLPVYCIEE
ncbi:MAG: hypothetical protein K8M05_40365 [Deltaproteobacteria bacterium]|nr:hypothetical protein [Kofleriaceae bacterium]